MVAKCRALWRDFAQEATLNAPNAAENFPAVMLQDYDPCMLCKADTAGADLVIEGSFASPETCTALALVRHNLTVAGSITLTTDSGATITGQPWVPIYPFGRGPFGQGPVGGYPSARERQEMMPQPLAIVYFEAAERFSDWTLTLSNPTNPAALELGRLFLGRYLETEINFRHPYSFGFTDPSQEIRLPNGAKRFVRFERLAKFSLDFQYINSAQAYSQFMAMYYVLGKSIPWIIDAEPEGPGSRKSWLRRYVRFRNDPPQPDFELLHRAKFKFDLEEAR
ncbi:MAG: hypothetical protein V1806_03775 [Pseudomonadota bacterium]